LRGRPREQLGHQQIIPTNRYQIHAENPSNS
jgi:hypothetical protein